MGKSKALLSMITLFLFAIIATGCVFGPKDDASSEQIDPPQVNYLEGQDSTEIVFELEEADKGSESTDIEVEKNTTNRMVNRTLYVFDQKGYVVPITVQIPFTESVATQALEYLVLDGPVTEHLPDGMRAVLPAGTEMSVNVKEDGTAVVDFSKEFKEYQAQDEKGILEAITWTLTEFPTIKQIKIMINGYEQKVMPVNNTPIGQTLSRKDGINIEIAEGTHLGRSSAVTLYFKAQNQSATHEYYVPVTRIVPRSENVVLTTVKELVAGPQKGSGLVSAILPATEIYSATVSGETVVLDFDEHLLQYSQNDSKASDDVIQSVVLSLTDIGPFTSVQFKVNGETQVTSYSGSDLSKPVTRPVAINQTGF